MISINVPMYEQVDAEGREHTLTGQQALVEGLEGDYTCGRLIKVSVPGEEGREFVMASPTLLDSIIFARNHRVRVEIPQQEPKEGGICEPVESDPVIVKQLRFNASLVYLHRNSNGARIIVRFADLINATEAIQSQFKPTGHLGHLIAATTGD